MSSSRRMLLAAVGVALSTPAFAREARPAPAPPADPVPAPATAPADANVGADMASMGLPSDVADSFDEYELGFIDVSACELTTANTKGPSYDSECLARLAR